MKMPNTKYTGSYIKGNLGGTKVSNPSLKKYYGKMIDAPGFKSGGKTAAWQRKEGKSESGGLNKKGVASYRAANPGSKLKTAVTGKVKPGSKSANRRKSYCARSAGKMKQFPKAAKNPNSRLRQARKRWKC